MFLSYVPRFRPMLLLPKEPNPLRSLRFVVLLWGETDPAHATALDCPLLSYKAVLRNGDAAFQEGSFVSATVSPGDLATLVYTSGTTGETGRLPFTFRLGTIDPSSKS